MRRTALALWGAFLPLLPALSLGEPRVAVIVEAGSLPDEELARALLKRLHGVSSPRSLRIGLEDASDPILKGKLLASAQASDLTVLVGDGPVEVLAREMENLAAYFIGVSAARGKLLSQSRTFWLMSYSEEDALDAAGGRLRKGLGLLYTGGYEPAAALIGEAARKRSIPVSGRKIESREEIVPAVRSLLRDSAALWVLGDPLLARGAGFEYAVERSLSQGVPLIGAGAWEVSRGALLCSRADPERLAEKAFQSILKLLASGDSAPLPRFETAPPGGTILYHRALSRRFGVDVHRPRWRAAP